jgi:cobalt transporter subunit CbtB
MTRKPGDLPTQGITAMSSGGGRREIVDMSVLVKSAPIATVRREQLRYGVAAILLGIVFIGVTGFAQPEAIHDAAHDTRHSITFPCH